MKNINRIILALMILFITLFTILIIKMNVLPIKHLILVIIIMILWIILLSFLLFKKIKKKNIIGYILSFILFALILILFYYISHTMNFFNNFNKKEYKEENYLILVNKDSNLKLENLSSIGYVPSEITSIDEALNKLHDIVKKDAKKYSNHEELFNDLFSDKISAIIIEETVLNILNEEHKYSDLYKILYTLNIKTEISINKEKNVTEDTFSIYISGIDSYGKIAKVSRSDVNMVVTINPKTKQILLISIPRDYYVKLRGTTGYNDKLTHAGIYGIETSVGTIEDLLNIEINYYFRVNFSSLERIVDALDGIDVYSKYHFTSIEESGGIFEFYKGYNHLTGLQALAFSRERENVPGGDRGRGINQQAIIDGLVRKATSSAIITKYTKILNTLQDAFQTNMTDENIQSLIKMQLNDMAKWNITSYNLTGYDSYNYTYSPTGVAKPYVMEPDNDSVLKATELVNKVIAGEVLESSYQDEATNIKNPTIPLNKPKIYLNGDEVINVNVGEEYIEQGVTISIDVSDKVTTLENVVITGEVDTNIPGTYQITYSITDKYNETASVTRTVIVSLSQEPVDPSEPIEPVPSEPIEPVPSDPVEPIEPIDPIPGELE